MTSKEMWVSQGSKIVAYEHKPSGRFGRRPLRTVITTSNCDHFGRDEQQDVCKFVVTGDNLVVASGSEGGIFTWSPQTGENPCFALPNAHGGATNGLAICSADIVLCGSKDFTVKVWKLTENHQFSGRGIVRLKDRVWSVAANTDGDTFVAGTAGMYDHPAILYCTETQQTLSCLGQNYKFGAGVLHCLFESNHSLLTAGYDTYIRLWDTRTPQSSVIRWENPYDLAVYCLSSDQNVTFVSGSAAHGLVWLWDKRTTSPVQMYYTGASNSPVYSLAFDPCHLYVALDHSLRMLSFT